MLSTQNKFRMLSVFVILALVLVSPALAASAYTLTDLGTLGGGNYSQVLAINEAGQITGNSQLVLNDLAQPGTAKIAETYGQLSLSFEPNNGQTDAQVKFISRGAGYSLFLTPTEAVLALHKPAVQEKPDRTALEAAFAVAEEEQAIKQTALHMQLVGANAAPQILGLEELPSKVNYLLGNDPAQWRASVPTFAKVRYQAVYPGVDLVYYGNQGQLEYDFIVAPGVDPEVIRLGFAGVDNLEVDAQGELVLHIAGEQVRMHKPVIYQERDGQREEISGGYVLLPNAAVESADLPRVGFRLGRYDSDRPLVIDPVLVYSTYLGGSSGDTVRNVAVDLSGNVYLVGYTVSTNFPIVNAVQSSSQDGVYSDVFVTKLNAAGEFVYSTYLGGSGNDYSSDLAVDVSGNAYLVGQTSSSNFPTANAVQPTLGGYIDAFVTKLNATGGFIYSTYLGGAGEELVSGFTVDPSGNAYIVGDTGSFNFPTMNAVQSTRAGSMDTYVTKLNATGGFIYSTYLGGAPEVSWFYASTKAFTVAVDASGNAYLVGETTSPYFPTVNAVQFTGYGRNAFVTKLNATGRFIYSTYLGGNGYDLIRDVAVDVSGNVYLVGDTSSSNFPTANAVQPTFGGLADYFVTKLNATGNFVYSTYLGGNAIEETPKLAIDPTGNAYVVGGTSTPDFPTANAVQSTHGGRADVVVTKLTATGGFVYSTYLGGSDYDLVRDVAVDPSGNVYIVGDTYSTNFPTANAVQSSYGGGYLDVFVTKLNATGGFVYSTYLGGNDTENIDTYAGNSLSVDPSGNAYLVGLTRSANFPTANAVQSSYGGGTCGNQVFTYPCSDVILTKLNATGGFVYSSYLGGSGDDSVTNLAVDANRNTYVAGYTFSPNFPTANAVQPSYGGGYNDVFVAKIADNQPPTTDAGGPYSMDEGASVTVTASGSDPEGGPLTYAWDLDNDGSFETAGQSVPFSALDGPSNHTITVQVTDEGGLTATASTTVEVLNVAPTATFTGTSSTIVVGGSVTLSFSNAFDPGAADTAAGFQYSYDCTNDGTFELASASDASYTCAYPNSGTFNALGRIADKDGDFTDYTVQVTVLTPREGTQDLIDQVQALIPGTLGEGQGNALISKLDGAIKQLEKGKTKTAVNELQAFISQVNDFMNSAPPILMPTEGQLLIDAANAIIAALGS